jgi:acetyl esterase/lipase
MLRLIGHLVRALLIVTFRRLWRTARRPSWSLGFETLVEGLRLHTRWLASLPLPAMRKAARSMKGPLARGVVHRSETLADIPVTWFEAQDPADGVLLYVHGGGHVFGSAAQDRGHASELARITRMKVVAPDHRLAPEAPCPANVDDLVAVHDALAAGAYGPPKVVAGLSAGGGAALSMLVRLRDAGKLLPCRAVLLSPMVDATGTSPSWSTNADVDWVSAQAGLRWAKMYAGGRTLQDAEVSPVNARLEGLPPILVIAGGAELLRDDAVRLADRARAVGVEIDLHIEPDMVHAFMSFGRNDAPIRRTFACIQAFLS